MYYVIIVSLPFILYYLCKVLYILGHDERYTEEERYGVARKVVSILQRNGFIHTDAYGTENQGDMSCMPTIRENMMLSALYPPTKIPVRL